MTVRFLLVTACADSRKWYANRVNRTAAYLGAVEGYYRSIDRSGHINFIPTNEARIIEYTQ